MTSKRAKRAPAPKIPATIDNPNIAMPLRAMARQTKAVTALGYELCLMRLDIQKVASRVPDDIAEALRVRDVNTVLAHQNRRLIGELELLKERHPEQIAELQRCISDLTEQRDEFARAANEWRRRAIRAEGKAEGPPDLELAFPFRRPVPGEPTGAILEAIAR